MNDEPKTVAEWEKENPHTTCCAMCSKFLRAFEEIKVRYANQTATSLPSPSSFIVCVWCWYGHSNLVAIRESEEGKKGNS